MKKTILILASFFMGSVCFGRQAQTQAMLNIRETDGTPSNYPFQFNVPNGSLTDGGDGTMTLSFSGGTIALQSTLQSGATFFVSSGTAVNFNSSTATITNLVATTTNDNALATSYGYSISSVTAANVAYPTTTQFGDIVSIPLAAGDWLCYGSCFASANGATVTEVTCGISQTTGNSATGLVPGDSYSEGIGPTAASPVSFSVLTRQSLSGSATIYLKYEATFSVATPLARGKLFCWKPR